MAGLGIAPFVVIVGIVIIGAGLALVVAFRTLWQVALTAIRRGNENNVMFSKYYTHVSVFA